jgi:hypothetical protein
MLAPMMLAPRVRALLGARAIIVPDFVSPNPSPCTYRRTSGTIVEADPASASPNPSSIDFFPKSSTSPGISSYFVFTINSAIYFVSPGALGNSVTGEAASAAAAADANPASGAVSADQSPAQAAPRRGVTPAAPAPAAPSAVTSVFLTNSRRIIDVLRQTENWRPTSTIRRTLVARTSAPVA